MEHMMPTIETQTENYKFDDKRRFSPDLYTDSTLKNLFIHYNAALDALEMPLNIHSEKIEEIENSQSILEQKKVAIDQKEQLTKTHYQLFLACQEKEEALKKTQDDMNEAKLKLAYLDRIRKRSFLVRMRDAFDGYSRVILGIALFGGSIGIPYLLMGMLAIIPPLTIFAIVVLSIGIIAGALGLLKMGLNDRDIRKKVESAYQKTETALESHEKQEKLLQTEIQQFSMDMLEKVEMTGTAVQATQDVPEVVGMKNTRDAFFQVNPSATATVTMTPKFVSAPGQ
jgi:hypothetical protein